MKFLAVIDSGDVFCSHVDCFEGIESIEKAIEIVTVNTTVLEDQGYRNVFAVVREHRNQWDLQTVCSYSTDEGWQNIPDRIV